MLWVDVLWADVLWVDVLWAGVCIIPDRGVYKTIARMTDTEMQMPTICMKGIGSFVSESFFLDRSHRMSSAILSIMHMVTTERIDKNKPPAIIRT